MKTNQQEAAAKRIRQSRTRKNILKDAEFATIEYLCTIMPSWVKPDLLTAIGVFGSMIIFIGLILSISNVWWMLLSVVGFAIQWFGDSLDGRIAYYRNTPRKWYGWSLDINADWISTCIVGLGFYFYFPDYKIISFLFVVAYGGSMIVSLMRYKIIDKYVIDSGFLGPTELRIIVSLFMIAEIFLPGALQLFGLVGSGVLMLMNVYESTIVMKLGDERDVTERQLKAMNMEQKSNADLS